MNKKYILLFFLTSFILSGNLVFTENSEPKAKSQNSLLKSIDLSSDRFDMIIKDSLMTFSKNVHIKSDNFESYCDKALVYLEVKTGKVKKIVMTGRVKLLKDNSQINGEKVTIELDNEKLTVEGNVKTKIKFSE